MPRPKLLWHANYWDGVISGVAMYRAEMVWINCVSNLDVGERTYALHRMSKEVRREVCRRHALFRKMVGKHCDRGRRYSRGATHPAIMRYYELSKAWPKLDHTGGEVIARKRERSFDDWRHG